MNQEAKEGIKLVINHYSWKNILFFGIILAISGGLLNMAAVTNNNGKMPVILSEEDYNNYEWSSPIHYVTMNESEINRPIMVDRFKIKNSVYSLGDFLVFAGILFLVVGQVMSLISGRKIDQWLKN